MDKTERRQQILNHARDVFAKRGYHAAKIDDIVAAAGVARGTFYLYFEDKRGIFEEIVDRVFTRLGMTILRVDPNDAARTVGEQIHENIRRIVELLLEDRATTKIMLSDAVGVDAGLRPQAPLLLRRSGDAPRAGAPRRAGPGGRGAGRRARLRAT